MGHNSSPYDYVIYVALIAPSRASLITSFQPPLVCFLPREHSVWLQDLNWERP